MQGNAVVGQPFEAIAGRNVGRFAIVAFVAFRPLPDLSYTVLTVQITVVMLQVERLPGTTAKPAVSVRSAHVVSAGRQTLQAFAVSAALYPREQDPQKKAPLTMSPGPV
jgi:hypothetical protein